MSKCVHCHGRKGKRACPALGGSICSACCGEHRLKTIACPMDCTYLGGLSLVASPEAAAVPFTREIWERATEEMYRTALERKGRDLLKVALERFGLVGAPEEWEAPILLGYATHVLKDERGRRYLDRFLEEKGRLLSAPEVAALRAHAASSASMFEITAVVEGESLAMKDLVTGAELVVKDASEKPLVGVGDYVYGWVMTMGDHAEMTGEVCIVPGEHREAALAGFRAALEKHRADAGDGGPEQHGDVAWSVGKAIRDAKAAVSTEA